MRRSIRITAPYYGIAVVLALTGCASASRSTATGAPASVVSTARTALDPPATSTTSVTSAPAATPATVRVSIVPVSTVGAGPGSGVTPVTSATSTSTLTSIPTAVSSTVSTTTSTTRPEVSTYVYPFTGKKTSYAKTHHDYPASDVFGCGAAVVAPTSGTVDQISTVDRWEPKVNDPATRGGKFVSMIGDDGVRYYFAHLHSVAVTPGQIVRPGAPLGVMGRTGNARASACHTHVGISWPCAAPEWEVRRGEIWPWRYLDAWRAGKQLSPVAEIAKAKAAKPDACATAIAKNG